MPPKTRAKFFKGTGDSLNVLHDEIAVWCDETGAMPTQYLLNVHYDPTQDKWAILVSVLYVDLGSPESQIVVPKMQLVPQRAD